MDVGGVVVGHYLLHQYLEERKQLFSLKANRNRLLEQKVRNEEEVNLAPLKWHGVILKVFCSLFYLSEQQGSVNNYY